MIKQICLYCKLSNNLCLHICIISNNAINDQDFFSCQLFLNLSSPAIGGLHILCAPHSELLCIFYKPLFRRAMQECFCLFERSCRKLKSTFVATIPNMFLKLQDKSSSTYHKVSSIFPYVTSMHMVDKLLQMA